MADPVPVRGGVAAQPWACAVLLCVATCASPGLDVARLHGVGDLRGLGDRRRTRSALRAVVPRQLQGCRAQATAAEYCGDCG